MVSVDGTRVGTVGLPDGTNQESVFTASVDLTAPDSNKFTLRLTIVGENVRVDDISLKRAE